MEALQAPAGENRHPPALLDLRLPPPLSPFEARLHHAREQMRDLLEAGEIDWQQLHDESVPAFAFDEKDADAEIELAQAARSHRLAAPGREGLRRKRLSPLLRRAD